MKKFQKLLGFDENDQVLFLVPDIISSNKTPIYSGRFWNFGKNSRKINEDFVEELYPLPFETIPQLKNLLKFKF